METHTKRNVKLFSKQKDCNKNQQKRNTLTRQGDCSNKRSSLPPKIIRKKNNKKAQNQNEEETIQIKRGNKIDAPPKKRKKKGNQ